MYRTSIKQIIRWGTYDDEIRCSLCRRSPTSVRCAPSPSQPPGTYAAICTSITAPGLSSATFVTGDSASKPTWKTTFCFIPVSLSPGFSEHEPALSQRGASSIYFRFLMLVNFLLMSEMVSVSEEIGHSQHTSYWIPRSCLIPPLFIVGDKPHECILCGKKFALQCNLKTHMKTHEGISFQMEEFTILLP